MHRLTPNRRARRGIVAVVLGALILGACGDSGESADTGTDTSVSASDALSGEVTLVDGSTLDLGSLAGTDTILWFWAPW